MKRAVIVHCWDGYPEYCWYQNTKKELEDKGFEVFVPQMPETHSPKLSLWLPKLVEVAGTPDEQLFLIGHSAGCITILRYLEQLSDSQKVGGVVLVAGFTDNLGYDELTNLVEAPVDYRKIKSKSNYFVAINSDDDPFVPVKHGYIFEEKLGARLIIKHGMGHFSGTADDTKSVTSLPDVSQVILSNK